MEVFQIDLIIWVEPDCIQKTCPCLMIVMQTDLTHSQTVPGSCICFVIIVELSEFHGGPLVITLMKEFHRRFEQVSNFYHSFLVLRGSPIRMIHVDM